MRKELFLISGIGLGAGLMYILDPNQGRLRRALIRDKTVHAVRKTGHAMDAAARDIRAALFDPILRIRWRRMLRA